MGRPGFRVPAVCSHCGLVFRSMIRVLGTMSVHSERSSQTCPRCGQMAEISEGTFFLVNDVLTAVQGPEVTKVALQKLQEIVEQAQSTGLSNDELAKQIAQVNPSLGAAIARNLRLPVAFVVLVCLAAIKSCTLNLNLDVNQLVDQLREQTAQPVGEKPKK